MIKNGELPTFKAFTDLGFKHNEQVYLLRIKQDGTKSTKFVIADDLLTSGTVRSTDGAWEGVLNDSKLTKDAGWTENQDIELLKEFDGKGDDFEITFEIRTNANGIAKSEKVVIKKKNFFRTQSKSAGTDVRNLLDNDKFNEIKTTVEVKKAI